MVEYTKPAEITQILTELLPHIPNTTLSEGELMKRLLDLDALRVQNDPQLTLREIILTDYCYHTLQYEKGVTGRPTQYKRLIDKKDAKPPFAMRRGNKQASQPASKQASQPASQPEPILPTWRKLTEEEAGLYATLVADANKNGKLTREALDSITIDIVNATREINAELINRNNSIKSYLTRLTAMKEGLMNQTNTTVGIMVNCLFTKEVANVSRGLVKIPSLTIDTALEYLPASAQRVYWEARQTATP